MTEMEEDNDDNEVLDHGEAEQEQQEEYESPEIVSEAEEEDSNNEPEPKAEPRVIDKKKYNQMQRELQREKALALQRVKQLEEELTKERQVREQAFEAASKSYDNNIQLRLEHAKRLKMQAIEEGDVKAQVEADAEIAAASAQLENMKTWQAQQAHNKTQPTQSSNPAAEEQYETPPEAYEWIDNNPWFDQNSEEFNPFLARKVQTYAARLEHDLKKTGREDLIMSQEYFDEIDRYVGEQQSNIRNIPDRKSPLMKKAPNPVAPVGKASQSQATPGRVKQRIVLSEDEKFLARSIGMKEEEYVKYILQDKEIQKQRGRA